MGGSFHRNRRPTMKTYEQVIAQLTTLGLTGITKRIDEELVEAEKSKESYISFLQRLLFSELNYRVDKRFQKNMAGAHFPVRKDVDGFEFEHISGISKMDISQLLEFQWLDNHYNVLLFGPPGLGKTHLAIGIGVRAVEKGYI